MKKWILRIKKYDLISSILMVGCIIGLILYNERTSSEIMILDFTIFSSIIMVAALGLLGKGISQIILDKFEDYCKLQQNYGFLTELYNRDNLLEYKSKNGKVVKFPMIQDYEYQEGVELEILDSQEQYQVPDPIKEIYSHMLEAHKTSVVYNQLNIRCDKWEHNIEKKKLTLHTSRTTYFDSLATNRSLDYPWPDDRITRDIYAYGPFSPKLEESELSNHLGVHALVESNDGFIPFMYRSGKASIAKNTLGTSIGAPLKTKSALDSNKKLTKDGLTRSLIDLVKLVLNLNEEDIQIDKVENMMIALYRELVEGGKPQMLFCIKSKLSRQEMEQRFNEVGSHKKKSLWSKVIRGKQKLIWIHKDELKDCEIKPDEMTYNGKTYSMAPSYSGSVVMATKYFNR